MFAIRRSIVPLTSSIFKRSMITAQAVLYTEHGEPSDVLFTHKFSIDDDNLKSDQVVVKTLASPVNPSDINQIQGVYPSKPEKTLDFDTEKPAAPCGNEGVFQVLKVGNGVSDLAVGDWVIPSQVNYGTWRTHALGTSSDFIKLPNPDQSKSNGKKQGLSINQAATISVNPLTAYLMLTHYLKLAPGKDWFIQNGGNSAVGKYASQVGRLLNFNSISVIRDRPDLDEVKKELEQLGATQVITEEDNASKEFGGQIKSWVKETGGELKLALNCVGGKSSTGIARKLGNNGLMLTYGGMSKQPVIIPTSLHIFKNFTSAGFWVTELLKNNQELKSKTLKQIIEWYENGELKDAPSTHVEFDGNDLAKLYQQGITDSKKGKQLITYK
ncbi:ETR1 [Candida theae]|uniref:enoyl-[acyl-carrier-protein] reductase n=1 Tax=Candida theae TaxID=1198502 RepID=A0AAD5BJE0_9ASCO|nr:ETR1 [Candida theae]KAI5968420.1 ETR1 [Candida theae]